MTELSRAVTASALAESDDTVLPLFEDDAMEAAEPMAQLGPQERLGRSLQDKREELGKSLDEIVRITKIPKASLRHIEAGRFDSLPGDVFARGFLRSYARCVELDGDDVVRRYAQCGLNPAPVSSALADAVLGGRRKTSGRRARGTAPVENADATNPSKAVDAFGLGGSLAPKRESNQAAAGTPAKTGNPVKNVLRDAFDLTLQRRVERDQNTDEKNSESSKNDAEIACDEVEGTRKAPAERKMRTFIPPALPSENDMTHRGPLTLGVIILVIVATLTMSYLLRRPGTSTDGFTMNSSAQPHASDTIATEASPNAASFAPSTLA